MIKDPLLIVLVLLSIVIFILHLSEHPRYKSWFKFLPYIFWIFFIPMMISTAGLIDDKSPVYQMATKNFLPASLFLLLISVDLKLIFRLGWPALFVFFAGSFGVMLGAVAAFSIFKQWVGPEFWSGFGTIAGSWTGGSANMIAVKESLATPDAIFLPFVVVDTIVPYVWMAMIVAASKSQSVVNRWMDADPRILEDINKRLSYIKSHMETAQFRWPITVLIFVAALIVSVFIQQITAFLPQVEGIISQFTWVIILASFLGLAGSMTPLHRIVHFGTTRVGYFLLYFVLTTIGAKANLSNLGSAFILIAAGFLIASIHGIVTLAAARLIRAPIFLVAAASQANLGGVASAPIVAEIYQPGLSAIGLLMAILGNIVGTYLGIMTGEICRMISGV